MRDFEFFIPDTYATTAIFWSRDMIIGNDWRARSHVEFVAKLGHVVEEADESVYWLELIAAAKVMSDPALPALIDEANELSAIFNQSQFTARMNQRSRTAQPKRRQLNPPFQSTNPNNPKFKSPQFVNS